MSRQPYENLKYRIHNIPKSTDLLEEFPDLRRHTDITFYITKTWDKEKDEEIEVKHRILDLNEMIRYMVYLYDPKSDLIKEESDLGDRKRKAVELSGFKSHQEAWVLQKAFYFLTRIYNDRKFREWCVMQQELEEKQQARWTPINEEETKSEKDRMEAHQKKGLLRNQSLEIHKALDALEGEIFSDNTDLKAKANELLLTTPEKMAGAYFGMT
jgi:hypothetical protein